MRKKRLHILFVLIVILTVSWWLLSLVLNSDYIISFSTKQLNKQLDQATNITLNFQALKFGAFPPRVEIYGVELFGKKDSVPTSKKSKPNPKQKQDLSVQNPSPNPLEDPKELLTKVSKVQISPSFTAFFLGSIKVNVSLTDLNLSWPLPVDLDKLIKPSEDKDKKNKDKQSSSSSSIPIDKLSIKNSTLLAQIEDEGSWYRVYAFDSNIELRFSSTEKFKASLDIGKLSFKYDDMRVLEDASIKTSLYWDKNKLKTTHFEMREDKLFATGSFNGNIKKGDPSIGSEELKNEKLSFEQRIEQVKKSLTSGIEKVVEELKQLSFKDNLLTQEEKDKQSKKRRSEEYFSLEVELKVESDFETVGRILDIDNSHGYFKSDKVTIHANIPFSQAPTELLVQAPVTYQDSYLSGLHLMDGSGTLIADTHSLRLKNIQASYQGIAQGLVNGSIGFEDKQEVYFESTIYGMDFVRLMKILDTSFTDVINFGIKNDQSPLIISGTISPFKLSIKTLASASSLEFLVLDQKETKFTRPDCLVNLDLSVDDYEVGFNQTQIKCLSPESLNNDKKTKTKNKDKDQDKDKNKDKAKTDTNPESKSNQTLISEDSKESKDQTGDQPANHNRSQVIKKSTQDKYSSIILSGSINYKTGVDLVLDSMDLNLDLISSYFNMQVHGSSSVFVNISGNESVKTKVYLKGSGSFNNVDIDDFDLKLDIADEIVINDSFLELISKDRKIVNEFYAQEDQSQQHGQIQIKNIVIDSNHPEYSRVNVSAKNIDKTTIDSLINNFISKDLNLTFDIDQAHINIGGDLSKIGSGQGDINLVLKSGFLDKEALFDKIDLGLKLGKSDIRFDNLNVENKGLGLKLTGRVEKKKNLGYGLGKFLHISYVKDLSDILVKIGVNPSSNIDFKLKSYKNEGFKAKIQDLGSLPVVGKTLLDLGIDSNIDLQTNISGTFINPKIDYTLGVTNLNFMSNLSSSMKVDGHFIDHKWTNSISSSGNTATGFYNVDFSKKDYPYELDIKLKEFDIRFLLGKYFASDFRNYAFLSASCSQKGYFPSSMTSNNISVDDFNLKYNIQVDEEYRPVFVSMVSDPFKISYTGKDWVVRSGSNINLEGEGINLGLKLKADQSSIIMNLFGKFDLPILKSFLDLDLDVSSGKIAAVGKAVYKDSDFSYDMKVFSEELIEIGGIKPPIKDLDFLIQLSNGQIKVSKLSLKKGSGYLDASGSLWLNLLGKVPEGSQDSSGIVVNFKNLDMMYFVPVIKNIDTSVSGKLKLTGNDFPFNLSGLITLDDTSSVSNADIRDDLVNAIRESSYSISSEVKDSPLVNLDLKVSSKQPVHISNRNMNLDLNVDLKVAGTDISPTLVGTVQVDKGKIIYRRKFNVSNGIITFDEYSNLDPKLDIVASSSIDAYQVGLLVSGRGSDPVVDFTIDPSTYYDGSPISKMDILNLIMGGSLNRNKTTSAVDSEVSTEQTMSAEAVSVIAGQLEKPIEYMLRYSGQDFVKQIYVDTYLNGSGVPTPRLNFPINVGEDLGLLFKISNSDWRVSVDYSIEDSILITGSYDRQNDNEGILTNVYNPVDTSLDVKFNFLFP